MMNQTQYAHRLSKFIFFNYKTQAAAAEAWGVSRATVSKVVAGDMRPTEAMLQDTGHSMNVNKSVKVEIKRIKL